MAAETLGPNPVNWSFGSSTAARPKRNFILLGTDVPRSVKLYESKSIHGLLEDHRETPSLATDDWDEINRLLINYKKN